MDRTRTAAKDENYPNRFDNFAAIHEKSDAPEARVNPLPGYFPRPRRRWKPRNVRDRLLINGTI